MKSAVGRGTQVEIWLPMAQVPAGMRDAAPVESEKGPVPTRALNVLAIDDDPLVLVTLCAQLEDLGHRVVTAASGAEGLRHLNAESAFDAVITDYAMPGVTGEQFAERAREVRPDLAVIIATGFAELTDTAGRDLIRLKKPFSQHDLALAIHEAVPPLPQPTSH